MPMLKTTVFTIVLACAAASATAAEKKKLSMDQIDALCDAVARPCMEACKAADYTAAQRDGCESTCISAWDDCRASATASAGSRNQNLTVSPTGGVLDPARTPRRKPPVGALPEMKLKQ